MKAPLRVLHVEDSPLDAKLVVRELEKGLGPIHTQRVETKAEMKAALEQGGWEVIISDWSLPTFGAVQALELVQAMNVDLPFIIVSGTVGEASAVEAMRAGASDYVLKDQLTRLAPAVERELREWKVREALRRSEAQLRQSQKMEAIGKLAGGVAHDFNNLLSVVLSLSDLILRDLEPGSKMREDLQEIQRAGERAAALTKQLLAFSRQQVLAPKVVDLNTVLDGMQKMLKRLIGEDVELVWAPSSGLRRVKVDVGQMEQVLLNLAVNARDAMPKGGKLVIETANVVLDEGFSKQHLTVSPGPHVMLAVSDTGVGIDEATQARIFEPFFTTKAQGKGTGLGLSTVFGIVQQSGGTIWTYSELGRGTTFKIYLPCAEGDASGARETTLPTPKRPGATILLVEDEPQVRAVARAILQREGYKVLEANDGTTALAVSAGHPGTIDLLLTDVVMPRVGGAELGEKLGATRPEMKALYMSGYTDQSIVHHGVLKPGIAFLQKPLTPDSLVRKVHEVLGS